MVCSTRPRRRYRAIGHHPRQLSAEELAHAAGQHRRQRGIGRVAGGQQEGEDLARGRIDRQLQPVAARTAPVITGPALPEAVTLATAPVRELVRVQADPDALGSPGAAPPDRPPPPRRAPPGPRSGAGCGTAWSRSAPVPAPPAPPAAAPAARPQDAADPFPARPAPAPPAPAPARGYLASGRTGSVPGPRPGCRPAAGAARPSRSAAPPRRCVRSASGSASWGFGLSNLPGWPIFRLAGSSNCRIYANRYWAQVVPRPWKNVDGCGLNPCTFFFMTCTRSVKNNQI